MPSEAQTPEDSAIPSFCWDRKWTVADMRSELEKARGFQRDQLAAWILREAAFREVWLFHTPREVAELLPWVEPFLGRWKKFWKYTIGQWVELGKIEPINASSDIRDFPQACLECEFFPRS